MVEATQFLGWIRRCCLLASPGCFVVLPLAARSFVLLLQQPLKGVMEVGTGDVLQLSAQRRASM
jgi:hypothetical protein